MSSPDPVGLTDLHSHLVPGVDDGARTVEESLEALGRLQGEGIHALVVTPHLDGSLTLTEEAFRTRMKEVDTGWRELVSSASETYPELSIQRGHEVMLDVPHPDLSDPRVRLAGGPFVLVEWPNLRVPPGTTPVLTGLRDEGHRLVLAHPERYHGLDDSLAAPGRWRDLGAVLQVNYGSLAGRYGDAARRRAFTFLERGWVDLFSTDFHGRSHLSLYVETAREILEKVQGEEQFHLLASVNPGRISRGEDPLPVPPLTLKRGFWEKIRGVFQGEPKW